MGEHKIRTLYDDQIFTIQRYGGISRYFNNLIGLNNKSTLSSIMSQNEYVNVLFKYNKRNKILTMVSVLFNRLYSIFSLKFRKYDIFHPTYYNPYFLRFLKTPFVLTVYDMIHEIYPEITNDAKLSQNKKILCEKANRIICISNQTKNDLIKILNINPNKIDVTYLATDYKAIPRHSMDPVIKEQYILFVGNRSGYKNFLIFIKSVYNLLIEYNIQLVCTGGGSFSKEEEELFDHLKVRKNVVQIGANEEILKSLYNNALLFIFPSDYEGFGIPILESFACGCPVALSRNGCFEEIAGEAGIFFNQKDMSSIYSTVKSLIEDNELQRNLVELGYKKLEKYSWEKTFFETNKVYEKVLLRNQK